MDRRADPELALAPIAPYFVGLAAAYAALPSLVWLAGELAGWLWTRRWPPSDAGTVLGVLANVLRDPGHPAQAWPATAQHDLAPAPVFYLLAVVLLAASIVPAVQLTLAHLVRGRHWSVPNPRRSGFANSTAFTTLTATRAMAVQPAPSYDLWFGLERGPMSGLRALRGSGDRQTASVVGPPGSGKTLGMMLPVGGRVHGQQPLRRGRHRAGHHREPGRLHGRRRRSAGVELEREPEADAQREDDGRVATADLEPVADLNEPSLPPAIGRGPEEAR